MHFTIIHHSELDSTNNFAAALIKQNALIENFVVSTEKQTNGRGQRENLWWSEPGKNLSFSIVLQNISFETMRMFDLNIITSLSIIYALKPFFSEIKIKWPNDIFANGKKIGGILIENTIQGNKIANSIIGIGINVNSEKMPEFLANATSLGIICQQKFDLHLILTQILESFGNVWNQMSIYNLLATEYKQHLWLLDKKHRYLDKNGIFIGTLKDVLPDGKLVLADEFTNLRYYHFKEVEFIYE
jgi:BirA family biotin operon repressor/biotin-[acetyl-CoA-carboxylase] ligase